MRFGAAPARAGKPQRKTKQFTAVESTNDLSANLLADHEHTQRNQITVVKIPHFLLQRDAGGELINAVALPDSNLAGPGYGRTHFFPTSIICAFSHKSSTSSKLACLGDR